MRLLKLEAEKLSFVEIPVHNTHLYAILSHTWIPNQEVTYQEILDGGGKDKTGFEKIKFCAKQAMSDGLLYFWVDTCCINKSDPTELSTAVNSMFRWYQNASKCYVYLPDVSLSNTCVNAQENQSTWEMAFQSSRWFTRGWTLQELVAPRTVEFFSKEGAALGSKQSLGGLITKITGIPRNALQGNGVSDFTIAERTEWAAQRETTVEEDMVYCLLGLCGLSMPAIYGEGKEAAMKRFQMTVRGFEERSELENVLPKYAYFIVPFDRNPNFTGRESQLTKLKEQLSGRGQTTKVAIAGLGGIGKTQLVLELAYQIRDIYKDYSVIWIPATNLESLHHAYLNIAKELNIPGWQAENADVEKLVQEYLSRGSAGRWLMIFDNADDIDMWTLKPTEPGIRRLIDYLPRSNLGSILFTTRDRKAAVKLAQKNVVDLHEMDESVAAQLLEKCLIDPELVNSESERKALLQQLTYLPLAIIQASAYINENMITLSVYLSLLSEQEEDVIDLLSEDFEDYGRYLEAKNPVATTWLISFKQLRKRDPLAADYLSFMACIEPKDIPRSLLPEATSRKKEVDAIGTLEAYSFVKKRSSDQALDVHRLVHLATRNWLQKEDLISVWSERTVTRLKEVFVNSNSENRSIWRTYFPHVQKVLSSNVIDKDKGDRMRLLWDYATCLQMEGRYSEAEVQFAEARERHERVQGPDSQDTLASIARMALIYNMQGRYTEARKLEVLVLEASKRVLGLEHSETLMIIGNMAMTYVDQGCYKEAEDLGTKLLETRKRVLGQEHPDTLTAMSNLALTYAKQGRYKEAEELGTQVAESRKRVLGQEHPHTLFTIGNLASTYTDQGRYKEAEDLETQVLAIRKRVLGPEHPHTLMAMGNLALNYGRQNRYKEAEELEVLVLEKRKLLLGAEHPETLLAMGNLALTYGNQKRYKEAEELEVLVSEKQKMLLGAEHPNTLLAIANLAGTYRNQGRYNKAEELDVLVLEKQKMILGAEHPSTLTAMHNLAFTMRDIGRKPEARKLLEECVELRARTLGAHHPDTIYSQRNMLRWQSQDLKIGD